VKYSPPGVEVVKIRYQKTASEDIKVVYVVQIQ
jgi:hypothetical protein